VRRIRCFASVRCVGCSVVGVEAHDLQEAWLDRALDSAGIERRSWRPSRGFLIRGPRGVNDSGIWPFDNGRLSSDP
jgi:hypothetical protein